MNIKDLQLTPEGILKATEWEDGDGYIRGHQGMEANLAIANAATLKVAKAERDELYDILFNSKYRRDIMCRIRGLYNKHEVLVKDMEDAARQ